MYYNTDYYIMYSIGYVYIHTALKIVFNLFRFYGHSFNTFNIDRLRKFAINNDII